MRSGVAKNTIRRYIEYLEAAFLIRIVHRVDESAWTFQRARSFKVYLTNPSMRAALFSPAEEDSPDLGALAETAVFAQYFHDETANLYYSRWKKGEVDIVRLNPAQRPAWAVEVKWSDRFVARPGELDALVDFCSRNGLDRGWVTSRTTRSEVVRGGVNLGFVPTAEFCYVVGHNIIHGKGRTAGGGP